MNRFQVCEHPAYHGAWIVWDTLYNRLMAELSSEAQAQSYADTLNR